MSPAASRTGISRSAAKSSIRMTSARPRRLVGGSGVAAAAGMAALTIGADFEGRSSRPRARTAWSASGRAPGCGTGTGSCRSRSGRTRSARGADRRRRRAAAERGLGRRPADPRTADDPTGIDYTAGLTTAALQGARIGVSPTRTARSTSRPAMRSRRSAHGRPDHTAELHGAQSILNREFRRDLKLPHTLPAERADRELRGGLRLPEGETAGGAEVRRHAHRAVANLPPREPDERAEYEAVKALEVPRAKTYSTTCSTRAPD